MEDVMVDKRRGGMKADQRHYPVGKYFVDFFDVMREGAIACPRGGNFEQAENWHGVPTSKLRQRGWGIVEAARPIDWPVSR